MLKINNNNDNTRKFHKNYTEKALSVQSHPKPTWTSPVFKTKETEQNSEVQKLKASVLGEMQVVSAVRFRQTNNPQP
jgi:hypothetical protein